MNSLLTSPLGETLGLAIAIAIAAPLAWPLTGLIRDMWQLPMAIALRPRIAGPSIACIGLVLFTATGYLLGPGHFAGRLMIVGAFGAGPALRLIRALAWRWTDFDLREQAAEIRNELANRLREPPVSAAKPWPAFIFDVERATRRARYEPPPL